VGRFRRTLEDGGDFAGILDGEMENFWGGHLRGILAEKPGYGRCGVPKGTLLRIRTMVIDHGLLPC
jgi:hypothetical protein